MKIFSGAFAFLLAAVLLLLYLSYFVVDVRQMALVQRFGQVQRIVEEPGLYFKMPFADVVVPIEKRAFIWNSDNLEVQVSDKKQYVVDMVTVVRVKDPQKFRESVGADLTRARKNIESRLDAALRQTYGKRTFEAALSKDRVVMMREIRDQVYPDAQNLGIDIIDVRIRQTDLMAEVLDSTYQRMSSERLAEAQDLRSTGEAERLNIEATADRQRLEKVSDATRQGDIIRGSGEAERSRIYAEVFQKDPEFFAFYRSMQAYAKGLKGNNTSFVVSPDSSFFQYFNSPLVNSGAVADRQAKPAAQPVNAPPAQAPNAPPAQ